MAAPRCPFPSLLLLALLALSAPALLPADAGGGEPSKTYIFRVDHRAKPSVFPTRAHWYASAAFASSGPGSAPLEPLHVYGTVFHGFSASVPASRAEELRRHPAVLAAFEDRVRPLHTTRSPQFTGLRVRLGLWSLAGYGSDVVVGVLDTGVWPERHSLSDRNLPPVPSRWRDGCDAGPGFPKSSCNRKLVGARFFSQGHGARRRGRRVQRVRGVHVPPRRRRTRDAHGHHRRGEHRVRGEHAGVHARGRQGRRAQGQGRNIQGVLEGCRLPAAWTPTSLPASTAPWPTASTSSPSRLAAEAA